jgi:5-formyltetrahydrofolate cyclo-ligase
MTKEEIRKEILKKRLSLNPELYELYSEEIIKKVTVKLQAIDYQSIALYYPIKKEVNIIPLIEKLLKESKQVYLPKLIGKKMYMTKVNSLDLLKPNKYKIPEPINNEFSSQIDIYIIPAIAYDLRKFRIGYGGGYYDNYFMENKKTLLIGIIFDFQLVNYFQENENDIKVDIVITEKRIIN